MRTVHSIPGGIHPAENKAQSLRRPIEPAGIPELIILPLAQHIGSPAEAIVVVGEQVKKGQKVAAATGFVSVPIHASTSGEVVAIEPRAVPHPSGMTATCVVIRPDGHDEWLDRDGIDDISTVDKSALIQRIQNAGIVGLGGAGFPSNVKLSMGPNRQITTLIINGTECEPYITADDILMRERADQIFAGVRILQHLLNPDQVLIGIEDNKPEALKVMRATAAGTGFDVVNFPTKYPSGGEKQLIQILTGLEVPSGGLPADLGIVVHNIGTAVAVYRAIRCGEPLVSRIITVTGNAVDEPGNFEVLLGTPIRFLLARAGFRAADTARLIMGGPMMGFALEDSDAPVVKTTNCILAPVPEEISTPVKPQACIRCGVCATACPASLLPQQLYWFSLGQEQEKLENHNLFDCIECGCCAYVCPSNIPLVQYYRASKAAIREHRQSQAKSERSRVRFEARQARLERGREEKEARRLARQAASRKAAASSGDTATVVEAAVERARSKQQQATPLATEPSVPATGATAPVPAGRSHSSTPCDNDTGEVSTTEPIAQLEQCIANTRAACERATATGNDKLEVLRATLDKLTAKLIEAKAAATAEQVPADRIGPVQAYAIDETSGISTEQSDVTQFAIERAKARRESRGNAPTPGQKVTNLKKRLASARAKLVDAEESGSDKVDILRESAQKLEDKLASAKRELVDTQHNG